MPQSSSQTSSPRISALLRTTILAGVALSVIPSVAFAQSATADDSETVTKPVEVTAAAQSTSGLAGGVSIDQEELDRKNPQTMKDVFSSDASVEVGGPTAIVQKIYVQGIENTKLNVQIDGARQVDSSFHHIGTAIIDPAMLKSVDVESGVAPADAGPHALGGSMSYETRDARDVLDANETFGGWGKLQYNSNTKGFAEWLTVAGQSGGFEALAYLKNSNQGNYKDGDGDEAIGTADGSESGLGKFAFTSNDGGRFEAFASHLEDEGVRPSRANFAVLANGAAPQWLSYRDTSVGVSYVDEMPSGQLAPELSLAYSRTVLNIPSLQGGPSFYHVKSDIQSINGKAANNFEIDNGVITAGIDFYRDKATGYHNRSPRNGSYSETSTDIGAFSQARLSLTDQWRVSFGGRADQQWFDGLNGKDFSEFGLSGNANTEFDVTEQIMVYGGAGTTFGGLPLGESAIYEFSGNWNYEGFAPSRSYNAKIGSRLALDDWTLDGNLFYNLIDESHDLSSTTRNSTVDLDTRGVNLSAQYTYGPGFARLTYSHTNVKTDGGTPLSTEAAYQGVIMGDIFNFDAGHSFDEYGLRVGGSSEFALSDDSPEDSGNEKLDSYFVANLYAEWVPAALNEAVTLRVDALNIFDRDYIDRATTGYDSTRISEPFHEPGRTFLLSAKVDF